MADLAERLSKEAGMPVLDGVSCAVKLAEGLASLRLSTARCGPYAALQPKKYSGIFSSWNTGMIAHEQ
jgi:allantoin racemase